MGCYIEVMRQVVEDVQVVLIVLNSCNDLRPVAHMEFQIDLRIIAAERSEDAGQEILCGGDNRYAQPARGETFHIVKGVIESPDGGKNLVGSSNHFPSCIGQVKLLADDLMQGQTHCICELTNLQ